MSFALNVSRAINLLKWPAAAGSMLVLIPALLTFVDCAMPYWRNKGAGLALLAGMAIFLVPTLIRRRLPVVGFWATFEHEMTHILFALLSFQTVRSLNATDSGGEVTHHGEGNWLIVAAPYFFPTVPLLAALLMLALPTSLRMAGFGAVGFTLAWHLAVSLAETHRGQPDLQRLGFVHVLMFLPGASVLCLGFVLALAYKGGSAPLWYWARLVFNLRKIMPW
jgi:hypothetical protein